MYVLLYTMRLASRSGRRQAAGAAQESKDKDHEGSEYNGAAKADDQGRGMTRLIAAPRADD